MIHEAAEDLHEHGFNMVEQVTDDFGTIGYVFRFLGDRYCLVAKEYAYDNLASFMARLVVDAPPEMDYIFYCDDDKSYTVFDGEYLREHGKPSQGSSKKRDCSWVELTRNDGAELDAYIRNEDSPATLAGSNGTLEEFA